MKRRALFVGVNEYVDSQIRNLNYALSDAHSLKAMFELAGGYEADILENPNNRDVLWTVKKMTSDLKEGDFFLFYFAGHGWTTSSGKHLLFCADDMYECLRIDEAGISFDNLKMMTGKGGFNRAFMLDACRADFMTGSRGADTTTRDLRPIGELVENAPARGSLAVLRSCSQFEHALEIESKKHGLFTLAMMDVLRESQESGEELLFGETLCDAVTARMTVIAREDGITDVQTPEFAKSGEAPVLISGRKAAAPSPSPVPPQPPMPPVNLVACPVCGKYNQITETFKCMVCGREHLCLRHYNEAENCCSGCAAAKPARQKEKAPVVGGDYCIALSGSRRIEMLWVEPGRFAMGSPEDEQGRYDDEKQHGVCLTRGFWLGRYAVTHEQWRELMGTDLREQAKKALNDDTVYSFLGDMTLRDMWGLQRDSNPMELLGNTADDVAMHYVNYSDCHEFCLLLNARERAEGRLPAGYEYALPSEAQWEFACRAGTTTALYKGPIDIWGERSAPALDEIAWYGGNSSVGYEGRGVNTAGWKEKQYPGGRASARDVGGRKPNPWGFYDMIGNVWEWCSDWYDGNYGCNGGDATDPQGPRNGSYRVSRGGCWGDFAYFCRAAIRGNIVPTIRDYNLGFRLALVPVQ